MCQKMGMRRIRESFTEGVMFELALKGGEISHEDKRNRSFQD